MIKTDFRVRWNVLRPTRPIMAVYQFDQSNIGTLQEERVFPKLGDLGSAGIPSKQ